MIIMKFVFVEFSRICCLENSSRRDPDRICVYYSEKILFRYAIRKLARSGFCWFAMHQARSQSNLFAGWGINTGLHRPLPFEFVCPFQGVFMKNITTFSIFSSCICIPERLYFFSSNWKHFHWQNFGGDVPATHRPRCSYIAFKILWGQMFCHCYRNWVEKANTHLSFSFCEDG